MKRRLASPEVHLSGPHRPLRRLCGPSNRKAAEVLTKYILTDMYAKAVQGMPAADAVKAAHAELVKIYA